MRLFRRRIRHTDEFYEKIDGIRERAAERDAYVNPDGGPPYHPYDPINDPHGITRWHGAPEQRRALPGDPFDYET